MHKPFSSTLGPVSTNLQLGEIGGMNPVVWPRVFVVFFFPGLCEADDFIAHSRVYEVAVGTVYSAVIPSLASLILSSFLCFPRSR